MQNQSCKSRSPLAAIDHELMKLFSSGKTADKDTHMTHLFGDIDLQSIPLLSRDLVDSGALGTSSVVRYRCLVQNMLDVEFYSTAFRSNDGQIYFSKYRDRIIKSEDALYSSNKSEEELEDLGIIAERLPLVCVPIPFESDWAKGISSNSVDEVCGSVAEINGDTNKRRRTTSSNHSSGHDLNCLVKIYDNLGVNEDRAVRVNDMLDVIGIYTNDDTDELASNNVNVPEGHEKVQVSKINNLEDFLDSDEWCENDSSMSTEAHEQFYSSKTFPRLHCLFFRILPVMYPLYSSPRAENNGIYFEVVDQLEEIFLGDRLAAEYAALALIYRTGMNSAQRCDSQSFGNLCLNLRIPSSDQAYIKPLIERFSIFLQDVLPRSMGLQINISSLNSNPLYVSNETASQKIVPSPLQLGGGTAVIIDETMMGEGQLNECGLKNLKTLKDLLSEQKLLVECQYYNLHIPTDLSFVTFSVAPTILKTSGCISVLLEPSYSPAKILNIPDGRKQAIREWWARCSTSSKPSMEEAVIKIAEQDFLDSRSEGQDCGMDADSPTSMLHRWILTAQMLAVADNSSSVSLQHWKKAMSLEAMVAHRRLNRTEHVADL